MDFGHNVGLLATQSSSINEQLVLPHSFCLYPYKTQQAVGTTTYHDATQFTFPSQSCLQPVAYSSQVSVEPSIIPWQTSVNNSVADAGQEGVLTPTNVPTTCFDRGAIAATPEFVYPRNSNAPPWLMSPPVGDQDASSVSYDPAREENATTTTSVVRKQLMTPEDFVAYSTNLPAVSQPREKSNVDLAAITEDHDSGIEIPFTNNNTSVFAQSGTENVLESTFSIAKRCKTFEEYKHELLHNFKPDLSSSVLSRLFHSLFSESLLQITHECLKKLSFANTVESPAKSFSKDVSKPFPIGVFWDIENCQVPNGKSALAIVQKIRKQFFSEHAEAEFMAVCDINKESKHVIQDLNNAQVNVIHVNATAKNAADDKLRQSIRRYAQNHFAPATVILITGDCNFTSEVSDLRHRHNYFVVLIHNNMASNALVQSANTSICYETFVLDLPFAYPLKKNVSESILLVKNLPMKKDIALIRSKLRHLSNNCGGKILQVKPPIAVIKFSSEELLKRAIKRLQGEDVLGMKISVQRKASNLSALSNHFIPPEQYHQLATHSSDVIAPTTTTNNSDDFFFKRSQFNKTLTSQDQQVQGYSQNNEQHSTGMLPSFNTNLSGIQLTISNIDSQLGAEKIQETIWNLVSEHCPIWSLHIRPHNRFTVMCDVTVPNVDDASSVLQYFHRKKIGSKRVLVTISQRPEDDIYLLKKELLPILRETGREGIKFYNLLTIYEQSCHKKLRLCNLQQLNEFISLENTKEGLHVYLKKNVEFGLLSCHLHSAAKRSQQMPISKIQLGLREFSAKLHALLHSHNGSLFLDGFEECYQAEFGSFPYPQHYTEGVYLEHEISYVPGVQIISGKVKTIVWSQPRTDYGSDTASEVSTSSRSKTTNIVHFSRELVDLLKVHTSTCLPLCDLKSTYQEQYGRSFGISGLLSVADVLSFVPHIVQVIGPPDKSMVILTHRAQVKRFTKEIVKILKNALNQAILVAQLPDLYYRNFQRPWNLYDYGVNVLSDILDDIPDGNICVSGVGDNIVLSLPTRGRTLDELLRTTRFSTELIEILSTRACCKMSFTEFVPTYHRQFGRQCKLSNYGFSKLIDLFESLPNVVQVIEEGAEKYLQLTQEEQLKVLTSQIIGVFRKRNSDENAEINEIPLSRVQSLFSRKYGIPLVPKHYNCNNLETLLGMLSHAIKMVQDVDGEMYVKQTERKPIRLLCAQLLVLLLDINMEKIDLDHLHQIYQDRYKQEVFPNEFGFLSLEDVVRKALGGIAKFDLCGSSIIIYLKPIYKRARRIRNLLLKHGGSMTLGEFNQAYRAQYHESLDAENHGFQSCEAMLRALSLVLVVKGFGIKKMLVLRNHMLHGPLSFSLVGSSCSASSEYSSSASLITTSSSASNKNLLKLSPNRKDEHQVKRRFYDDSHLLRRNGQSVESMFITSHHRDQLHNISSKQSIMYPCPFTSSDHFRRTSSDPYFANEYKLDQYQPHHSAVDFIDDSKFKSVQSFQFKGVLKQKPSHQSKLTKQDDKLKSYNPYSDVLKQAAIFNLSDGSNLGSTSRIYRNNHGQRASMITLINESTSLSLTSSPDSFASTMEDSKLCSDECNLPYIPPTSSSRLRLAVTFPTTSLA